MCHKDSRSLLPTPTTHQNHLKKFRCKNITLIYQTKNLWWRVSLKIKLKKNFIQLSNSVQSQWVNFTRIDPAQAVVYTQWTASELTAANLRIPNFQRGRGAPMLAGSHITCDCTGNCKTMIQAKMFQNPTCCISSPLSKKHQISSWNKKATSYPLKWLNKRWDLMTISISL